MQPIINLRLSVTALQNFRLLQTVDWYTWERFVADLTTKTPPTEAMQAGNLVHQFAENGKLSRGAYSLEDSEHAQSFLRAAAGVAEVPVEITRDFSGINGQTDVSLRIRGRVDLIHGNSITDHKVKIAKAFDPFDLAEAYQWRYYLLMMDAQEFTYRMVKLARVKGRERCYSIKEWSDMKLYLYDALERDCMDHARACLSVLLSSGLYEHCIDHEADQGALDLWATA